jgi:O-antigen ligase
VKLSKKKVEYIKRTASKKKPEEIARNLEIRIEDVHHYVGRDRDLSKPSDKSRIFDRQGFDGMFQWGLVAFCFLAPLVFIRGISDFANLTQMAFIQTGVCFFVLIWLVKSLLNGKWVIFKSRFYLPVLALFLWASISIIYAHNRYESTLPWMHWTASAMMFFLVGNSFQDEKYRNKLIAAIFLSGCVVALLGIGQYLFHIAWIPQASPPAATLANKNMAAHFVVLTLPLSLGFILNTRVNKRVWLYSIASAVMVVFLVYTQTRAGWVALAAEMALFVTLLAVLYLRHRDFSYWNRNKSLAACVAAVIIFILINLGPQGFSWRIGNVVERASSVTSSETASFEHQIKDGTTIGSVALRLAIWKHTLAMIKDHFWVGVGLGNHKIHYPPYHHRVTPEISYMVHSQLANVHNDYLQVFAELGLIGFILLGWLFYIFLRTISHLHSTAASQSGHFRLIGIEVAIFGLLVNACFSFPFQRAIPPFILMTLLGLISSYYTDSKKKSYEVGSKWIIVSAIIVVSIVFVWLVRFHYTNIKCDRHFFQIERLEKSEKWREVIAAGKKAYAYKPDRVKILSHVGRAYVQLGEYPSAVAVLQKVLEAYPNFINSQLNIGVAYHEIGNDTRATEAYKKALSIKPDYAKAHFNIGLIAMGKKHYRNAAKAFEKAVEFNPKWDAAHKNLAVVYFQFLNRKKEGLAHFKEALKLNPEISEASEIRKLIESQKQ